MVLELSAGAISAAAMPAVCSCIFPLLRSSLCSRSNLNSLIRKSSLLMLSTHGGIQITLCLLAPDSLQVSHFSTLQLQSICNMQIRACKATSRETSINCSCRACFCCRSPQFRSSQLRYLALSLSWFNPTHVASRRMHHDRVHGAVVPGAEAEDQPQAVTRHQNQTILASTVLAKRLDCVPGGPTRTPPSLLALCPCQRDSPAQEKRSLQSHARLRSM